ncbi:LPS-assembly protein LptD [Rubrivivax gelatinosus]|uniref:LPS-assembly protein LptD n=1 Tax=Rubrivivax gelatinosus TaxID=28068 RepID=A0A4V2SGD7_RUBGE|nr:LPS assembly protein LptD [Rubrivivax gelatinosus]MBK1686599.1 organic solvent tolerance protein [Rubrivivax gelatinosus]TCP00868.1 LPS-assembly protein [Rubrivivax gelatinosus]
MRLTPLALAAGLLFVGAGVRAQALDAPAENVPPSPLQLIPDRKLDAPPGGEAGRRLPIVLRAQEVRARPNLDAVAEGDAEFRRGGTVIQSDRLSYDQAEDLAVARGHVRIERAGAIYWGPELQLRVQRFEGFFLEPEFELLEFGSGGRADRIDFLDSSRARLSNALYTSCPRDGGAEPGWVLEARSVRLDFDANEGVAEGAVLRFLGTPILGGPAISFPLTDERKSGWLPPSIGLDSRSGLELTVPYYWNIAPNRDATIAPWLSSKRGAGAQTQFRYLEPSLGGTLDLDLLPGDRVAGRSRSAWHWEHDGRFGDSATYSANLRHVSDDGWWKDFPDSRRSLTPRLLSSDADVEQPLRLGDAEGLAYLRMQRWQVLQDSDQLVTSPYQRSPQTGLRLGGAAAGGLSYRAETEFNRFTLPADEDDGTRLTGDRVHLLASVARRFGDPGWWLEPRLAFNAASYRTDQRMADGKRNASRSVPTFSLDFGVELERETSGFGRALRQTLEPRLLYVRTPYEKQSDLPNFDSFGKDFNFQSIYSPNIFSGVDRVSDANQLTAGVTSRVVDAGNGKELFRLGVVQRYLFSDQRITSQADGTPDGEPFDQQFSDVLLLGSTSLVPSWTLDGTVQYSPEISRTVRSVVGARYSPGPFRTIGATYRFARGLSEQVELGWQWPLSGRVPTSAGRGARSVAAAGGCSGTWYGVGRFNYSMRDSRITDSILGVEYDAGCWIGRFVAERLSTGRSEATTRLMFQLELVGLSRLGSNPLGVLKDNIPGYTLLREERRDPISSDE